MRSVSSFIRGTARFIVALCIVIISFVGISFCTVLAIIYAGSSGDAVFPADCALVFGASVSPSAQINPAIIRRITTAASLYHDHKVSRLVLTGGRGAGNRLSEAAVMKMEAIDRGVHSADITLEENSHSTWDNLLYSRNLTSGCKSVVGISDGYHLARIKLLAGRLGWKSLQTYPAEEHPPVESERRSIIREAFGFLYYAFHLDELVPTAAFKVSDASGTDPNPLVPTNRLT